MTAEGYRDLIVKTADAVSLLNKEVANGTEVIANRVYFKNDTAKAKLAAQAAADYKKTWSDQRVPRALQASHAEILAWIGKVQTALATAPGLMAGGDLETVLYLAAFSHDDIRKKAASALAGMGVTLPPIEKQTREKK